MLLLTGYEPFGEYEINPSAHVARELDGETVADHPVVGEVLPVDFGAAGEIVRDLIADHRPDAVVGTGLAAGRTAVSVERVGVNVDDCVGVPDNADAEPRNQPIDPGAPDAYFATLPVTRAVEKLRDRGIPARLSNTAGTHLCNHFLYATRRHAEREDLDRPVGFVHLPHSPDGAIRQADEAAHGGSVPASMPHSMQVDAVRTVLSVTAGAD